MSSSPSSMWGYPVGQLINLLDPEKKRRMLCVCRLNRANPGRSSFFCNLYEFVFEHVASPRNKPQTQTRNYHCGFRSISKDGKCRLFSLEPACLTANSNKCEATLGNEESHGAIKPLNATRLKSMVKFEVWQHSTCRDPRESQLVQLQLGHQPASEIAEIIRNPCDRVVMARWMVLAASCASWAPVPRSGLPNFPL